ncbi:MAG: hypothetical protein HQM12_09075 [SAR324 cluster bacterium]|nr:hypothetical protein [SAR324 cluster bacterium]
MHASFFMKTILFFTSFLILITGCADRTKDSSSSSKSTEDTTEDPVVITPTTSSDCAGSARIFYKDAVDHVVAARANSKLSVSKLSLPAFKEFQGGNGLYYSQQSFAVPNDAISFHVSAFESSPTTSPPSLGICYLFDPNSKDYVSECVLGDFGITWEPSLPTTTLIPGTWTAVVLSSVQSASAYVAIRSGTYTESPILVVKPYLTGTRYTSSNLTASLEHMVEIYKLAGITLELKDITTVTGDEYATISGDFTATNTAKVVCSGGTTQVNLILAEDLTIPGTLGGTLLGISSGIPGPHGIEDRHNGVLIGLAAHDQASSGQAPDLHARILGETMAHEMGHWLGLYHTTESTGSDFDPLADTPECPLSSPTASTCQDKDGTNLMFWTADVNIEQKTLTSDQQAVLKRAPIMQ